MSQQPLKPLSSLSQLSDNSPSWVFECFYFAPDFLSHMLCSVLNCVALRHLAKLGAVRICCRGLRICDWVETQCSRSCWKHTHWLLSKLYRLCRHSRAHICLVGFRGDVWLRNTVLPNPSLVLLPDLLLFLHHFSWVVWRRVFGRSVEVYPIFITWLLFFSYFLFITRFLFFRSIYDDQPNAHKRFMEKLDARIRNHDREIEKMCNFHHQGFVDAIKELLKVRADAEKLMVMAATW